MTYKEWKIVLVPFEGIRKKLVVDLARGFDHQDLTLNFTVSDRRTVRSTTSTSAFGVDSQIYRRNLDTLLRNVPETTCLVGITSKRLLGDLFVDAWDRTAIITTHSWEEYYSPPSLTAYLVFNTIVSVLFAIAGDRYDSHSDIKGCIFDYCQKKEDIYVSMNPEHTHICPQCIQQLYQYGVSDVIIDDCKKLISWYKEIVLAESVVKKKRCFVLMPFKNKRLNEIFESWRSHMQAVGLTDYIDFRRADESNQPEVIYDYIIKQISESEYIVADISKIESGWNANVCYELGYADAVGKRPIIIAQGKDALFFDKMHFRAIVYENTPQGVEELCQKLAACFRELLGGRKTLRRRGTQRGAEGNAANLAH